MILDIPVGLFIHRSFSCMSVALESLHSIAPRKSCSQLFVTEPFCSFQFLSPANGSLFVDYSIYPCMFDRDLLSFELLFFCLQIGNATTGGSGSCECSGGDGSAMPPDPRPTAF
jgi:hypothetical protein